MESGPRCWLPKLAKKTKVMNDEIQIYSLVFPEFSIEFDVDKMSSIEWTRGFNSHDPDFVFAISEVWLRSQSSRHLIENTLRPGNIVEELKDFAYQLSNPSSILNLENIIPCGGWCAWMSDYWRRLENDCNTVKDEENYSLLISLSLMDSDEGHIVVYRYNGVPTIEVGTRAGKDPEPIVAWSQFDPEKMSQKVTEIKRSMTTMLLKNLRV